MTSLSVIKRNGSIEAFSRDEIKNDIAFFLTENIKLEEILDELQNGLVDKIQTIKISELLANICASRISWHPDHNKLAAAICTMKLHKETDSSYIETMTKLFRNDPQLISEKAYNTAVKFAERIESAIDYNRDFLLDFFGLKTLERSYLKKIHSKTLESSFNESDVSPKGRKEPLGHNNEELKYVHTSTIIERPQHLWMTVSLGIHGDDIQRVLECYDYMSRLVYVPATPSLYNLATNRPQGSSCFILDIQDNIESIFKVVGDMAKISKYAGGIGVNISRIRSKNSVIRGTNGTSDGIVPLCVMLNKLARYINQSGRRSGSIATYMEPWCADIFDFVELRKNTGDENNRARDLFLGLWVNDIFMKRVEADEMWSLMCPDECPGLVDTYGDEFEALYTKYESEGKYKRRVKAKDLWYHILDAQCETGMPYMCYKDHVNKKSNHQNVGVINSSNLCSEIMEHYNENEYAVCNLSSICLPKFVRFTEDQKPYFDFNELLKVAKIVTRNLDRVIDVNFYPVDETKTSNMKMRPIGVGVQGLADVFYMFKYPYGSDEARLLNKQIFETIYYGCLTESCVLSKESKPYDRFEGSPFSKGQFQFHMWGLTEDELTSPVIGKEKWLELKTDVMKWGCKNSLLTTVMPTASTSQIQGNTESIEPKTSNLYMRKTLAGEFVVINEYLVKDLIELGLWNDQIRNEIIYDQGSIQNIEEIPQYIKDVYKTAFEMKQRDIVLQSVERGPYVDQSQSLNLFFPEPDFNKLSSSHFYGWKNGIKTGMYYLRTAPASAPIQFGLDPLVIQEIKNRRISEGKEFYKSCPMIKKSDGSYEICESCQ
jgi:ribonucleoside-diphosphate reductase alpha chain